MGQELVLKYSGGRVDDGSILVEDLISGLNGLVKVANVVIAECFPEEKNAISLRVEGFQQGSFKVDIKVNIKIKFDGKLKKAKVIAMIVSVMAGLSYYYANDRQLPENLDAEAKGVIINIIGDDNKVEITQKGFNSIAAPLRKGDADMADFGLSASPQSIMNKSNMDGFTVDKGEQIHKKIYVEGEITALNKKTLKGEFTSKKRDVYEISLKGMNNPSGYFRHFNETISISGVETYNKKTGKRKIAVEEIQPVG